MSIHSQLHIAMNDSARIIKRLTNHWQHKIPNIEYQAETAIIPFDETAKCHLTATETHLIADIFTADHASQAKLQEVVLAHINRMAHQEFTGEWQIISE